MAEEIRARHFEGGGVQLSQREHLGRRRCSEISRIDFKIKAARSAGELRVIERSCDISRS